MLKPAIKKTVDDIDGADQSVHLKDEKQYSVKVQQL